MGDLGSRCSRGASDCCGQGDALGRVYAGGRQNLRGRDYPGCSTTTEDASGDLLERTPVTELLEEALIDEAMESMTGEIRQIPPMYSAVKVNGRKLMSMQERVKKWSGQSGR